MSIKSTKNQKRKKIKINNIKKWYKYYLKKNSFNKTVILTAQIVMFTNHFRSKRVANNKKCIFFHLKSRF